MIKNLNKETKNILVIDTNTICNRHRKKSPKVTNKKNYKIVNVVIESRHYTYIATIKKSTVSIFYTHLLIKINSKVIKIININNILFKIFVCNVVVCIDNILPYSLKFYEENKLKVLSKILFYLVLPLLLYINQY